MKKTNIIYIFSFFIFLASCSSFDAEKIGKNFIQQYENKGLEFLQDTSVFTKNCIDTYSQDSLYVSDFNYWYKHFGKDSHYFEFDYLFVEHSLVKNLNSDDIYPYYKVVVLNTKKNFFFLDVIEKNNVYYINSFYFPSHP